MTDLVFFFFLFINMAFTSTYEIEIRPRNPSLIRPPQLTEFFYPKSFTPDFKSRMAPVRFQRSRPKPNLAPAR